MTRIETDRCYEAGIRDANTTVDVLAPANALNSSNDGEIVLTRKSKRIPALDFTKGALVLIMVFYHWLNYFVTTDGSVYKYLRFLTPSFIFITGFLISKVYIVKYHSSGQQVPARLVGRGIKLLAIVLFLNLAPNVVRLGGFETRLGSWSLAGVALAYFTGIAPVAFSILVPIAYVLILSAALLVISRRYRNIYHIATSVFVISAMLFESEGVNTGYLQIFSIGMLGISVGYIPIDRINSFVKHPTALFFAYVAYLCAITRWNATYPLQIIGVCLSLAALYLLGLNDAEKNLAGRVVILLGQYSLFAYIAQIVILQILRRTLGSLGSGIGLSGVAFLACLACTALSVGILDRARITVPGLDRAYMAVFG